MKIEIEVPRKQDLWPRLDGIVLVGGRSRRMGRDKATITEKNGKRWMDLAIERLYRHCSRVFISGQSDQRVAWWDSSDGDHPYPADRVIWVDDLTPNEGPMSGVLSVMRYVSHQRHPDTWAFFVLATDMYAVPDRLIQHMIRVSDFRDEPLVLETPTLQPTCAIYPGSVRLKMREAFRSGQRSLSRFLKETSYSGIPMAPFHIPNFNTPEDLDES